MKYGQDMLVRFLNRTSFKIDDIITYYLHPGPESHFGLFRNDQSPKPVARALRFLSGLLNDTGGGTQSLHFFLKGLPVGGQYLLFQKSDKSFVLVVWNNAPVYNPVTQTDISTASVQVWLLFLISIYIYIFSR